MSSTTEVALAEVMAELAVVRAELAELRAAQIGTDQPAPGATAAEANSGHDRDRDGDEPVTSRRRLFAIAGGAAAAAVVVGAATNVTPAAAATGATLLLGGFTQITAGIPAAQTYLDYTPASSVAANTNYFAVSDTGSASAAFPAAIAGFASKNLINGVYGFSNGAGGNGVVGRGVSDSSSYGVWGRASTGYGVVGASDSGIDIACFGTGRFYLTSGVITSGTHSAGEIIKDASSDLWLCTVGGSPGTFRKLAGPTTAGALHVITPARVYDSRLATQTAPNIGGTLSSPASRVVRIADAVNLNTGAVTTADLVPIGATAIVYNLTIVSPTNSGFLAVTPGDATDYSASTINWATGIQVLANGTLVKIDSNRQVKVFSGGDGATHFIIDVVGYYI